MSPTDWESSLKDNLGNYLTANLRSLVENELPNISSDGYQAFAMLETHPLKEALVFQDGIILDALYQHKGCFTVCKKTSILVHPSFQYEKEIIESKTKNQDVFKIMTLFTGEIYFLIWTQRFELGNLSL